MGLIYSGQPIRLTQEFMYEGDPCVGRFRYELPDGSIVADVFDFWMDDNEPRRKRLLAHEWELLTDDPVLHEEMYERGLFYD
jgi:hypothetical protein